MLRTATYFLQELAEVIEKPNGDKAKEHGGFKAACETLSSAYYSYASPPLSARHP